MKKFPSCEITLPKDTFESYIQDWIMPTNATPDLISNLVDPACLSSTNSTHPTIIYFPISKQDPRTGNNYAGLALNEYYREYLEVKLTEPLIPGQVYCCEMFVSFNSASIMAHDGIGMYFSDEELKGEDDYFYFQPQITADSIITDSINWVRIHGNFIPTTPARYLTIGNFKGEGETDFINVQPFSEGVYAGAYYYFDDISVQKVNFIKPVITGNKSVCPGDTLKLRAEGWDNITWHAPGQVFQLSGTNDVEIIAKKSSTTYYVRGTQCEWPVQDTVKIIFNPEPELNLGNDTLICEGSQLNLSPGPGLVDFYWQDGSQNPIYSATEEGMYKVTASNSFGCKGSDSIQIGLYEVPFFELGDNIEQCEPAGVLKASTGHTYDTYLWNDLSTNSNLIYNEAGTYSVVVSNPCKNIHEDSITIHKVELFLPNLITTNSDGLNDKLFIKGALEGKGSLSVFNRYGACFYNNDNYKNEWPIEELPTGVYYYEFEYPSCEVRKSWIEILK